MKIEEIAAALGKQFKELLAQRDATIEELSQRLKSLEDRPAPKDGRDGVDGKDGAQGEKGERGSDAGIEELAVRIKALEDRPLPRDGRDGQPGPKGDPGNNGFDGRDGQDGWSPDHVDFTMAHDGTGEFRMVTGDKEKSFPFRLPVLQDRGPYRDSTSYLKGHGVTYGGDFWICQEDNPGPPGKDFAGWRLAVRKGRDARSAKV